MGVAIATIVIIVILIVIVFWAISVYNNLVTMRNRVKNGWAQTDVQLKQRADLVPNLVATVQGYAAHESSVFEEVAKARSRVVDMAANGTIKQRAQAENALGRAIVNILATAENYPELKANQNFMDLQNKLSELEQKIAYARQFYHDVVMKYNTKLEVFPSNLIAGMFHFEQAQSFSVTDQQDREAPRVNFGAPTGSLPPRPSAGPSADPAPVGPAPDSQPPAQMPSQQ